MNAADAIQKISCHICYYCHGNESRANHIATSLQQTLTCEAPQLWDMLLVLTGALRFGMQIFSHSRTSRCRKKYCNSGILYVLLTALHWEHPHHFYAKCSMQQVHSRYVGVIAVHQYSLHSSRIPERSYQAAIFKRRFCGMCCSYRRENVQTLFGVFEDQRNNINSWDDR